LLGAGVIYLRRIISNQQTAFAAIEAMKKVIDDDYADPPVKRDDVAAPASGLPVGAPAPDFSLASLSNEQVTLDDLLVRGKPVLLLFVSANCGPCKLVLDSIAGWERSYHKQLTIALLTQGDLNANQDMARYRASHVLLQADSGVADLYRAPWTPAATLIGPSGRIAVKTTYGHEEINDMVTRAASMSNVVSRSAVAAGENLPGTSRPGRAPSPARTTGANGGNGHGENMRDTETRDEPSTFNLQPATNLQPAKIMGRSIRRLLFTIGEPAPSFSLEDLDGGTFSNEDLLGRDTLLLFWNPNCPYCRHTADDIADWEINPPKRAPRLVFVSSGSADSVRAESIRFKSLFLHDPELTVGALFGSRNTPSAVLIDSSGRIASSVQPGRVGVLALAGVLRPRDITTKVGEADPRDSLPPDTIFSNE
jgi:peroxiredoxin